MNKTNRPEIWAFTPSIKTRRPALRVSGHGLTDVGQRREANEDSFLVLPRNHLWVVADGMGGHAGGQVASRLTVQEVGRSIVQRLTTAERSSGVGPINVPGIIEGAVLDACALVFDTARAYPELAGMGSTCTMMLLYGSIFYFGHVGDSRAYLIRNGEIHQVTEDHSLVQEQVAAGLITAEQARHSMMRNIITRSIGFEREVKVDVGAVPAEPGDIFLMCSDGLTGEIEDAELLDAVLNLGPRQAGRALIDLANARGGDDNSTVILTEVHARRKLRGRARFAF
ncbi:MAG: Stp1/IreP family PP2C-type Ser/Thr phosphatase [Bradymonadia bacterium]